MILPNIFKYWQHSTMHSRYIRILTGGSLLTKLQINDAIDTALDSKPTSSSKGVENDMLGRYLGYGNGQGNGLVANNKSVVRLASGSEGGLLLWTFVHTANPAGKSVDFHGTDYNGALTETINFQACTGGLAGWIYATSTKKFITLETIDLNGMGGNVDYEVYQETWGILGRDTNNVMTITDTPFYIEGEVYLEDKNFNYIVNEIESTQSIFMKKEYYATNRFYLGERSSDIYRTSKNGGIFTDKTTYGIRVDGIDEIYWHDVAIKCPESKLGFFSTSGRIGEIWNCNFVRFAFNGIAGNLDVISNKFSDMIIPFVLFTTTGLFEENAIYDCDYCLIGYMWNDVIAKGVKARNIAIGLCYLANFRGKIYLVDWDVDWSAQDIWAIWFGSNLGLVYRQHSYNLKVQSSNGDPIPTAFVEGNYKTGVCWVLEGVDANGNLVADKLTTKGFWNNAGGQQIQYTGDGTGNDYEHIRVGITATEYFTDITQFQISERITKGGNIQKLLAKVEEP